MARFLLPFICVPATGTDNVEALSLLQFGAAKDLGVEGSSCPPAPLECPEQGEDNTNTCPEGCKPIENCDMCESVAKYWKQDHPNISYDEAGWPASTGARPTGCFRNRKWQIKCNPDGPFGPKKGKWPVCQIIVGHKRWVGTQWEKKECCTPGFAPGSYWDQKFREAGISQAQEDRMCCDGKAKMWRCDGKPTGIQCGRHNQACDRTRGKCAGGRKYGYGVRQLRLIKKSGFPNCPAPPQCTPGFGKGSYWDEKSNEAGVPQSIRSQLCCNGATNMWLCGGKATGIQCGGWNKKCNSGNGKCAGGDTYGYGVNQLMAIKSAGYPQCSVAPNGCNPGFAKGSYWDQKSNEAGIPQSYRDKLCCDGKASMWRCNGTPTGIQCGGYNKPCDASKGKCAGRGKYGYGVKQLRLIKSSGYPGC